MWKSNNCILLTLLAVCFAFSGVAEAAKSVSASVTTPWLTIPQSYVMEAAEILSDKEQQGGDPSYFWRFLDVYERPVGDGGSEPSKKAYFDAAMDAVHKVLNANTVASTVFQLVLDARGGSPSVELHSSIAKSQLKWNSNERSISVCNNKKGSSPAMAVAVVESKGYACDVDTLDQLLAKEEVVADMEEVVLYDFDHKYRVSPSSDPVHDKSPLKVLLYGIIGEEGFNALHNKLSTYATTGRIEYVVRHAPFLSSIAKTAETPKTHLKGYGVSLDLKSMEYKALDDRDISEEDADSEEAKEEEEEEDLEDDIGGFLFSRLISRRPEMEKELKAFQKHLHVQAASDESSSDIKVWDMKDLGLQATTKIATAKDKLLKLQSLSQNFPLHAKSLTRVRVKKSVRKAVSKLHKYVNPGESKMTLNGRDIDPMSSDFAYLNFLQSIQEEGRFAEQFKSLGFTASNVEKYTARLSLKSSNDNVELLGQRIDVRTGAKGAVYFMNNIEKDKKYKQWPKQLQQLLQHAWHIIPIRRNLYTGVFVVDPLTKVGLDTIAMLYEFIDGNVPLRIGLVMVDSKSNTGNAVNVGIVLKLLALAKKEHKQPAANAFLKVLSQYANKIPLTKEDLVTAYATGVAQGTGSWSTSSFQDEAEKCLNSDRFDSLGDKVLKFFQSKGLKLNSYLLNGKIFDSIDTVREELMQHLFMEQQRLQRLVSVGKISGRKNVYAYLTGSSKSSSRRNSPWTYPRFHEGVMQDSNDMEFVSMSITSKNTAQISYLYNTKKVEESDKEENVFLLTYFAVVDLSSETGLKALLSACEYLAGSDNTKSRFAVFDSSNSAGATREYLGYILKLFETSKVEGKNALEAIVAFLKELLDGKSVADAKEVVKQKLESLGVQVDADDITSVASMINEIEFLKSNNILKNINHGDNLIIVNGRVIRDVSNADESLFELIEGYERTRILDNSKLGLMKINKYDSDTMMVATSIANQYMKHSRSSFNFLSIKNSRKKFKKNLIICNPDSTNRLHVVALIDPLSEAAQRFAPILILMRDTIKAKITIVLNPKTDISEFPIKNFYRYVGGNVDARMATFRHMPTQHILTMKVFTPEHWVVMKTKAVDDLDNIRLDDQTMGSRTSVSAEYSLTSILVTGTCEDLTHMQPPNGLQLVLDSEISKQRYADTLVMQNLGYFQLRARPGMYNLRLARGRASKLYSIAPGDVASSSLSKIEDGTGLSEIKVTIRSFSGSNVRLRVRKQKGMERRRLLAKIPTGGEQAQGDQSTEDGDEDEEDEYYDEAERNNGLWGQITTIFGNKKGGKSSNNKAATADGENALDTIHVFSLASGHLYERLLRIMMLSVRKRTSGPIKFWLVENFLSPQFKESIQFLASEMGFDVGLVTYKWPNWLRRQTEKQRIIWGYKILFLDVLFPLNVPKIITVDADQVVRADLRELWEMDLEGAPYGYTPFCTSRKETLGFQFWREGYWKNHLQGKPYHISALYVVDLIRFRRMAAGDKLRAIYDNLSRDPNSLSNLDQDLPNYAQNQIPIFSLPQEWLWCQSWCSDSTLETAKTIDLCNHPKTKEAKLDMARRIISGKHFKESWVELDEEVASVLSLAKSESERTCKDGDINCGV